MNFPPPNAHTAQPAGKRRKSRKRKLPKVISGAEAAALLDAADDGTERGTRDRLMLELMYRAGLRVSEVTNLNLRDVESDGVIRLYDAKGGDGTAYFDPARIWPLVERWLDVRQTWINRHGDTTHAFFINTDLTRVSVRYIQRLVKKLKLVVGIVGIVTPHVLRHSYATELLDEGFTITEVQAALRHANLQTTAVYLHVRDESLRRKISRRTPEKGES